MKKRRVKLFMLIASMAAVASLAIVALSQAVTSGGEKVAVPVMCDRAPSVEVLPDGSRVHGDPFCSGKIMLRAKLPGDEGRSKIYRFAAGGFSMFPGKEPFKLELTGRGERTLRSRGEVGVRVFVKTSTPVTVPKRLRVRLKPGKAK